MSYASSFKSEEIEHKLGLVHGVPTLDHEPTTTDLTYTDDTLGEVTFNVGDKARYYDSTSGGYKMYVLMNVEDGSADWQEMTMGVSVVGGDDYILDVAMTFSSSYWPMDGDTFTFDDEDEFTTVYDGVGRGKILRIRTLCGYYLGISNTFMTSSMSEDAAKSRVGVTIYSAPYYGMADQNHGRIVTGVFDSDAHSVTFHDANVDYLRLDNTTEYTPTEDYHPATKKYVDDFAVSSIVIKCSSNYFPQDGLTETLDEDTVSALVEMWSSFNTSVHVVLLYTHIMLHISAIGVLRSTAEADSVTIIYFSVADIPRLTIGDLNYAGGTFYYRVDVSTRVMTCYSPESFEELSS